ncbi:MAG: uracil-DNA glycosylase [Anaerolineae bacterium]|nr:uracil-DNA glycosylase [Anaerolineae bacterium]
MTESRILGLVAELQALPSSDDVTNPYGLEDESRQRAENLRRYLLAMYEQSQQQTVPLLLMEAPGYRGCRLTGLPVTSRVIVRDGVPELRFFGAGSGYHLPEDAGFEDIQGEQSATIVWRTLAELGVLPLIWNSFPLHPHKAGQPRSNRRPRKAELAQGRDFLRRILEIYQPSPIVAVGRVAESMLQDLKQAHYPVRHPAQGGKNDFVAGLHQHLG